MVEQVHAGYMQGDGLVRAGEGQQFPDAHRSDGKRRGSIIVLIFRSE